MSWFLQYGGISVEQFLDETRDGIQKNMGDAETVFIAGKPVGKSGLLAQIAEKKKLYDGVRDARNELDARIKARDAAEPDSQEFCEAIEAGITSTWGTDPNVKAKYGVPAPKAPRQLTVEEKMAKVSKAKASKEQPSKNADGSSVAPPAAGPAGGVEGSGH